MNKSIYTKKHKDFCKVLAEKRKLAGFTQETLASKLDRPQSFVAKYEGGERRIDVIELIEIAQALGFDPAKLVKDLMSQK